MQIRNIIFDLGGVLLNIDYKASISAFKALGVKDFDSFFTQASQSHLFDRLDRGEIEPQEFFAELRQLSGINLSDADIEGAWNAMLLDLPAARIKMLEGVAENYNTFLLSNTNAIHYPAYMKYMTQHYGIESLEQLFRKQYLSHQIGLRKPEAASFEIILKENDLEPSETLFIDDTIGHVKGAAAVGLHSLWLDLEKTDVLDLFTADYRLNGAVKDHLIHQP